MLTQTGRLSSVNPMKVIFMLIEGHPFDVIPWQEIDVCHFQVIFKSEADIKIMSDFN